MYDIVGSIVVYRNSATQLREAMASFLNTPLNVKLYLIDNSPDDSARSLCGDARVTYVFNGQNLGYGSGHNVAMKVSVAEARFHLVLNPDVYFGSGVLEDLFDFGCSRPDIGLIMPKVLNPDGSLQYLCKRLPSPSDLMLRRFLPRLFEPLIRKRLARYEFRDQDYDSVLSVPVLSGCFMMINRVALSQVGGFDERFFMYLEDVDLSRRIHQQFKTVYFPRVAVYHRYAKGSYRSFSLMSRHLVSAWRYFQKWGWYRDEERKRVNKEVTGM